MPDNRPQTSSWRKEPMVWLIVALPVTAIIGSLITVWLASSDPDALLVSDGYHREGLTVSQVSARDTRAATLGLNAQLQADDGRLLLSLTGRLDRLPDQLRLSLLHPTHGRDDRSVTATATRPGHYAVVLPEMTAGQRQIILEPIDRSWRLTGHWTAPFQGSLHLGGQPPGATSP